MRHPVPARAARDCLRRLVTPHALDFGTRLLHRGSGGVISFREFLAVARDFVRERPDQTAVYLAALVALDMGSGDDDAPHAAAAPSPN
jgi:hypothetical protein